MQVDKHFEHVTLLGLSFARCPNLDQALQKSSEDNAICANTYPATLPYEGFRSSRPPKLDPTH